MDERVSMDGEGTKRKHKEKGAGTTDRMTKKKEEKEMMMIDELMCNLER